MTKKTQDLEADNYLEKDYFLDKMVATVQLRETPDGVASTWWVSGPGELWMIRLLLELQMQISRKDLQSAVEFCDKLVQENIFPLAALSGQSGGLRNLAPENSAEVRLGLARKHISFHTSMEHLISDKSGTFSTAQLYFLAKGFAIKNPVQFMADFFDVPTSTITRRLTKAREDGLIPKHRQAANLKAKGSVNTNA
jgi:hypothetical protein